MPEPRVVTYSEAAAMLKVSERTFRRTVLPDLRVVRVSPRKVVVPVRELDRWLEQHSARHGEWAP